MALQCVIHLIFNVILLRGITVFLSSRPNILTEYKKYTTLLYTYFIVKEGNYETGRFLKP
jgi:hypothetical protein